MGEGDEPLDLSGGAKVYDSYVSADGARCESIFNDLGLDSDVIEAADYDSD